MTTDGRETPVQSVWTHPRTPCDALHGPCEPTTFGTALSPTAHPRPVLLDLDGTLVDSVHLHVTAWSTALHDHGHHVPSVDVHAAIGVGGDRLLRWLLGGAPADADRIAATHRERFLASRDHLRPTRGAQDLLDDLRERRVPHAIATSAGEEERQALLAVLDVDGSVPVIGPSDDAASKPAPDLIVEACAALEADPSDATFVGDAPWDALASRSAGATPIAVRCGGFADAHLREAGASRVVDGPADLVGVLG